ncbi:MFS-type Sugar/inositol transporter [Penicillium ucsense]|uniref:MFS-type Sugar/inositol transporter n=1 Tax=Penicillium ucsense TaxID=2839758 RepID=A0A8J8W5N4_9EURO|nr:MFS-type Sugar/inositol transporter [Penicillium ucsense]KAF7735652.1 MFS-type Sugar/inositol transporter [Penicillium ucsense]
MSDKSHDQPEAVHDETPGSRHGEPIVHHSALHESKLINLADEARQGAEMEKNMSLRQALRLYPKAIFWSIVLSTALVMEGYDTLLLANFYGLPTFAKKYGTLDPATGKYSVSAPWRSGLSNGAAVGEILGLFLTGLVSERIGYRKTILGALVMITGFIFITFFAVDVKMLLVGEILCGLPWGVFQTITTAYASEVCPVSLRAHLTTYNNLCWVIGHFIASGVLRGMVGNNTAQAYRIPFGVQWAWPPLLIVGVYFAPESPWWLVRKGRLEEAKHSLLRLTSANHPDFDADKTIAMMAHTNEIEKEISSGTRYIDCFKGVDLRRTEICTAAWVAQSICGSAFIGYSTTFYEQAGLPIVDAFDLSLALYAIAAVGTMLSWWVMTFFGRRKIYVLGLSTMCVILFIVGMLGIAPKSNKSVSWAVGSMLLVFAFVYDSSVGPVCYSLVAEMSSTRLRAKTIVIARNCYNIAGLVVNVLINYQLTPTAWNWGAKAGFFWMGTCFLCLVWSFFRLPEPKGRNYAELDILFESRVSARHFARTKVNPYQVETVSIESAKPKSEPFP